MNGRLRTLIVGVGGAGGDDVAGPMTATLLARRLPRAAVRCMRSPLDLTHAAEGFERLHVVDACRGAGPPGTIVRRTWPTADLPGVRYCGTHDFGLVAALALAERLQTLPPCVTIWGIEAQADADASDPAIGPSPAVVAAAELLADRLAEELADEIAVAARGASDHA